MGGVQSSSLQPGTVILGPFSCLMILYKITFKQWQDAIDTFLRNYANIVRLSSNHVIEIMEDLALKRQTIHEILQYLELPEQVEDKNSIDGSQNDNESDVESSSEPEQGFDIDIHEFIFSMIMLSTGNLSEKVQFCIKRLNTSTPKIINAAGVLMICMAVVKGLEKITKLRPPSYYHMVEFSHQKESWSVTELVESLEQCEGPKIYLDSLYDMHGIEDARTNLRRLKVQLQKEIDVQSKMASSKRKTLPSSKSGKVDDDGVKDTPLDDDEFMNMFISPEQLPDLLKDILPNLDYDIILRVYSLTEETCLEKNITFAIKNTRMLNKQRYGFYRPISLEDFNIILQPILPFIALDKRKVQILSYHHLQYLNELCMENDSTFEKIEWEHLSPIRLSDWIFAVSRRELISHRVRYEQSLVDLFNQYDKDCSGLLDHNEIAQPVKDTICTLITPTQEQMGTVNEMTNTVTGEILRTIDFDESGKIDFQEFKAAINIVHSKLKDLLNTIGRHATLSSASNAINSQSAVWNDE